MNDAERLKASRKKVWHYAGEAPNDLKEKDLQYLASLPEYLITAHPGTNCMFSHYINPDIKG